MTTKIEGDLKKRGGKKILKQEGVRRELNNTGMPGQGAKNKQTGGGRNKPIQGRGPPAWYEAVECAFVISEKKGVLLLPGSPDSTLLYAAEPSDQLLLWNWWCRKAWLSDSVFDE
jgi:hypothetical protein